jgi:hypothetical protein
MWKQGNIAHTVSQEKLWPLSFAGELNHFTAYLTKLKNGFAGNTMRPGPDWPMREAQSSRKAELNVGTA